jgi:hypothetical protein
MVSGQTPLPPEDTLNSTKAIVQEPFTCFEGTGIDSSAFVLILVTHIDKLNVAEMPYLTEAMEFALNHLWEIDDSYWKIFPAGVFFCRRTDRGIDQCLIWLERPNGWLERES